MDASSRGPGGLDRGVGAHAARAVVGVPCRQAVKGGVGLAAPAGGRVAEQRMLRQQWQCCHGPSRVKTWT